MNQTKLQLGWWKKAGVRRGSALLITLLMLGVLMTLTLGISNLVIREIRVTQSIVDANKAYYAAEAGVEDALLKLKIGGEGVEPEWSFLQTADCGSTDSKCEVANPDLHRIDPAFSYDYNVSHTSKELPGFTDQAPIFVEQVAGDKGVATCAISNAQNPLAIAMSKEQLYKDCPRATYRKLALNQTDIIPLFSVDSYGQPQNVEDFLVEYYMNVADGSALAGDFANLDLQKFDVLRWKIYGKPVGGTGVQKTESIADFYPAINNNGPTSPVCIGTDSRLNAPGQVEKCIFPVLSQQEADSKGGTKLADLNVNGLWSSARECYRTDAGNIGIFGELSKMIGGTAFGDTWGCMMSDFISHHSENYLVLTNMVNPNVVGITDIKIPEQLARADIYYRIIAAPGDDTASLVKDYAEINSNGFVYKGTSESPVVMKNLQVKYKPPKFLPVFNFSLYKVCSSGVYVDGICQESPK